MIRWPLLVGAALLVNACARTGVIEDGLSYSERQNRLAAVTDWDLRAQLIVDTGERRDRVRLSWQQRGDQLNLTVRGIVLGAGSFRVAGDSDELIIEGRGEARVLTDPELDLSREVGWWLPVTSLEHWLLGREDPDFPGQPDRSSAGVLDGLSQRDWQIRYDEYQLAEGMLVPQRITMAHEPLELTLTISDWQPVADEP